jgi:hypothetical protein
MNVAARIAAAIALVTLAIVAIVHYRHDEQKRDPVNAYAKRFKVEVRRPPHAKTIDYAPSADDAAEIAADVALQDAVAGVKLSDIEPEARQAWLDVIGDLDSELRAASGLLVGAVRQRPGWPYHKALLGEIEYTRARRAVKLGANPAVWLTPLQSAMAAAPGDRSIATFAGSALADSWPFLDERDRAHATPVFAAALHDPAFVSNDYLNLVDFLGHAAVFKLLPEEAASLRAAIRAESEVADVEAAADLYARWQRAEMNERDKDLAAIEERAKLNDVTGQTRACQLWANRHSVFDFDDARGRKQAGRVLELWPDEPGSWGSDDRSEFIRYFLDRNGDGVNPHAVYRAAEALSDTPRPVFARAALLAGDTYSAESAARNADTAGAFEWTPFFVDLAYSQLKANRLEDATAALAAISPSAQGECAVEVARAAIAAAKAGPAGAPGAPGPPATSRPERGLPARAPAATATAAEFRAITPLPPGEGAAAPRAAAGEGRAIDPVELLTTYPAEYWSRNQLPICINPATNPQNLVVDIEVKDYPALISYGFDQARTATQFMPMGRIRLTVPLNHRTGRHIFAYKLIAGSAADPLGATIE